MLKGIIMTGWIKGLLVCLLLGAIPSAPQAADFDRLVIVRSSDNSFFNQTIATLLKQVGSNIRHQIVDLDALAGEASPSDLYIGLGAQALI